jgi:hypothetical protein
MGELYDSMIYTFFLFSQNTMLSVRLQSIFAPLNSMADAHFRCNLISADSSVVPDTLIDLFLNLKTC